MENLDLHQIEYYTLVREKHEQEFIQFLIDDKELSTLILPFLKFLADGIFDKINNRTYAEYYHHLQSKLIDLNDRIGNCLSNNKQFLAVDSEEIKNNLFSKAFDNIYCYLFSEGASKGSKYTIEYNVEYWIEQSLGLYISKDERFNSLENIFKVLYHTEFIHKFYYSLKDNVSYTWIRDDIDRIINKSIDPATILDSIRTLDNDYFHTYTKNLKVFEGKTPWAYMIESSRYADQALFNYQYSFINSVLYKKDLQAWLKFWIHLKYPILQTIPFHYQGFQNPEFIISVAKELIKYPVNFELKVCASILMRKFFDGALKIRTILLFYNDSDRIKSLSKYEIDEELLANGKIDANAWEHRITSLYHEFIKTINSILSVSEIEDWVFSYSLRASNMSEYDNAYNQEVELLIKVFTPYISQQLHTKKYDFNISSFNLQKFTLLSSLVEKNGMEKEADTLINKFITFVNSKHFYWDKSFAPVYFKALKGFSHLIRLSVNPVNFAENILQEYRYKYEGWRIETNSYDLVPREVFLYCGVALLIDYPEVFTSREHIKVFFLNILNLTLSQMRYAGFQEKEYLNVLYVLLSIVKQVHPEFKKDFEIQIIDKIDNLKIAIEIFSIQDYKLDPENYKILSTRIDNELMFYKMQLKQKGQNDELNRLENSVARLGNLA